MSKEQGPTTDAKKRALKGGGGWKPIMKNTNNRNFS